jgi:hypothetical protein
MPCFFGAVCVCEPAPWADADAEAEAPLAELVEAVAAVLLEFDLLNQLDPEVALLAVFDPVLALLAVFSACCFAIACFCCSKRACCSRLRWARVSSAI